MFSKVHLPIIITFMIFLFYLFQWPHQVKSCLWSKMLFAFGYSRLLSWQGQLRTVVQGSSLQLTVVLCKIHGHPFSRQSNSFLPPVQSARWWSWTLVLFFFFFGRGRGVTTVFPVPESCVLGQQSLIVRRYNQGSIRFFFFFFFFLNIFFFFI